MRYVCRELPPEVDRRLEGLAFVNWRSRHEVPKGRPLVPRGDPARRRKADPATNLQGMGTGLEVRISWRAEPPSRSYVSATTLRAMERFRVVYAEPAKRVGADSVITGVPEYRRLMPRVQRRATLRGTLLIGTSKRRRFLFRLDPDGILAVRIGSPLAFSAFLGILLLAYIIGWPILGPASLLAGGAVGLAALGLIDEGITRTVAGQPREAVLRSRMNVFLSRDALRSASIKEGAHVTRVRGVSEGVEFVLDVTRPDPTAVRMLLAPLIRGR